MEPQRIIQIITELGEPGYPGTIYGLDEAGAVWELYATPDRYPDPQGTGPMHSWRLIANPTSTREALQ